ncbi:hypothetical protein LUZ61_002859 [Rhynchospora tenuis]|uniref:Chalcone--flavanone isomerase n=1 Tax=Rhynchospora tenuis TaxID=198213 RepID=A0AAD5ZJP6_9POAL|nr:hypothetical protein LUZ61_002859 [Rhynchospora tenuis]
MRRDWLLLPIADQTSAPNMISSDLQLVHGVGLNLISQVGSLVDTSLKRPKNLYTSGTIALQDSLNRLNKITGALFFWISKETSSNLSHAKSTVQQSQIKHCVEKLKSNGRSMQIVLGRFLNMTIGKVLRDVQLNPNYGVLSLAASTVPPFDNISPKMLAESVPFASYGENCRACTNIPISEIAWIRDTTEQQTGIKFPTFLEDNFNYTTELLVGTGSKTMTIMRFKTLKVYAFGLYIHPDSLCEKLGRKYASTPAAELKNNPDFLRDLLREDIHMTVRLVVNCNGLSISKVRKTFEKCLRSRLEKMNPETDYHCLQKFGSYFSQDIRIPMGTTIDFRQTAEGQLITEINGRHIGAVQSKDLCKAFFDMYVGDLPVSAQAKNEIAGNVGSLIKRC